MHLFFYESTDGSALRKGQCVAGRGAAPHHTCRDSRVVDVTWVPTLLPQRGGRDVCLLASVAVLKPLGHYQVLWGEGLWRVTLLHDTFHNVLMTLNSTMSIHANPLAFPFTTHLPYSPSFLFTFFILFSTISNPSHPLYSLSWMYSPGVTHNTFPYEALSQHSVRSSSCIKSSFFTKSNTSSAFFV